MLCRGSRRNHPRRRAQAAAADPDSPLRNDPPVILVPESQEDVSGDSQQSDGFIASSLPAQEAASPSAHPNSPPPPPPSAMPAHVQAEDDLPHSEPPTRPDFNLSSSDEEEYDYEELTDHAGNVRRFWVDFDNNNRRSFGDEL